MSAGADGWVQDPDLDDVKLFKMMRAMYIDNPIGKRVSSYLGIGYIAMKPLIVFSAKTNLILFKIYIALENSAGFPALKSYCWGSYFYVMSEKLTGIMDR